MITRTWALLARLWSFALTLGTPWTDTPAAPNPTHDGLDEDALVEAALVGDGDAFETLLRRHLDAMYAVALRITLSPSDADDVVQEASVRIWRALDGFERRARFSTWAFRITTNVALNHVGRQPPTSASVDDHDPASAASDPSRRIEERARLEAALDVFSTLPVDQRTCLALRESHGLAYEEIAEVLDTTVAAVKGRLFRAREAVATRLAAFDLGPRVEEGSS